MFSHRKGTGNNFEMIFSLRKTGKLEFIIAHTVIPSLHIDSRTWKCWKALNRNTGFTSFA
jgi:hypothetical protein